MQILLFILWRQKRQSNVDVASIKNESTNKLMQCSSNIIATTMATTTKTEPKMEPTKLYGMIMIIITIMESSNLHVYLLAYLLALSFIGKTSSRLASKCHFFDIKSGVAVGLWEKHWKR